MANLWNWWLTRASFNQSDYSQQRNTRIMYFLVRKGQDANIVQALGLYVVVLKLGFGQIVVLFFWQWLMAVIIGGPMGYAFYRAVRRAGVFQ